jgi:hypothetical protein
VCICTRAIRRTRHDAADKMAGSSRCRAVAAAPVFGVRQAPTEGVAVVERGREYVLVANRLHDKRRRLSQPTTLDYPDQSKTAVVPKMPTDVRPAAGHRRPLNRRRPPAARLFRAFG